MGIRYKLAIGLLGKGSTNHLHQKFVVEAFQAVGVNITFLIRKDYENLISRIDGADYEGIEFTLPRNNSAWLLGTCRLIRRLYPSSDIGRAIFLKPWWAMSVEERIHVSFCRIMARKEWVVRSVIELERRLYNNIQIAAISSREINQLLLLGVGTVDSELEGLATWWALERKLPIVHFVGNYDNLSSKGYRGIPVRRLLVWGPSMIEDAKKLQGIKSERITAIGSLRYNAMPRLSKDERHSFLQSIGLDLSRKTILFAGFIFPFHYFEMLSIFRQLVAAGESIQLILRIYPNKNMMQSVYMNPLLTYARSIPNVYVSIGDPYYKVGSHDYEVLQIEEDELNKVLNSCDVVINQFSTISIEACLFDKPAINMWYFPPPNKAMLMGPIYKNYLDIYHIRRMQSYDAIPMANSREEVIRLIQEAIEHPHYRQKQRATIVQNEIGIVDGRACERLVSACVEDYEGFRRGTYRD